MGVSLQTYRVRIGTFKQSVKIGKIKTNGPSTTQFSMDYKSSIMVILMSLFLTVFIHLSEESLKIQASPSMYPTITPYDTSSGPFCSARLLITSSWTHQHWSIPPWPWPLKPPTICSTPLSPTCPSTTTFYPISSPCPSNYNSSNIFKLCYHLLAPRSWLTSDEQNSLARTVNGNRSQ